MNKENTINNLITIGHDFYHRGWVYATSGNFSVKLNDKQVVITESGKHKGELTPKDFLVTDMDGVPVESNKKPSSELKIHTLLYKHYPKTQATLHTHSTNATVLTKLYSKKNHITLQNYEMIKAFDGMSYNDSLLIPIFDNHSNMQNIVEDITNYLKTNALTYGLLIRDHGLYTWGTSLAETQRYVEAFEFLFECEYKMLQVNNRV